MPGKVIVLINPKTGERILEVQDIPGAKCETVAEALIRNNEVMDSGYTEEYHIPDQLPQWESN